MVTLEAVVRAAVELCCAMLRGISNIFFIRENKVTLYHKGTLQNLCVCVCEIISD